MECLRQIKLKQKTAKTTKKIMNTIQLSINVNFGVTPELNNLLTSLLNRLTTPTPVEVIAKNEIPAVVITPLSNPEAVEEQPQPVTEKIYTEVDVREAMDRTRKRIEGENYKEQTASEGYVKWHRALTGWFKNASAFLGADKPSALPDSDSRKRFCAMCDELQIIDGQLTETVPF